MKYLRITIALFALMTLILIGSCCGDGSNSGSQNSGQSAQNEEPEEPEEPEIFDFAGTDPDELLETWENMGEDPDDVSYLLTDEDGYYHPLIEWHITEIARDEIDEYVMEIEEDRYILQAVGGDGIINFRTEAYDEEGMSISHFDHDGNIPVLWLNIEEAMEIAVTFVWGKPWADGSGVPWTDKESVPYCWFLYEE